jgi:hypothetical protein
MEAVRDRKQAEYTDVGDRTRREKGVRKEHTDKSRRRKEEGRKKEESNRPMVSKDTRYVYYSQVESLLYFPVSRVAASLIRI